PDENYAREVMQLFSIGLVQLHPDGSLKLDAAGLPLPTYTQTDIGEMARVFTGWSFSVINSPSASNTVVPNTVFSANNGVERYEDRWTNPMAMFADKHDTGAKAPLGLSLPAGQSGEKDLSDVLDGLAGHPNAAPFICRRLIQRFVSANPSYGYLYRVSNVFRGTGGNLPAVVKAILLDPEARSLATGALASSGKSREPLLRTTALLRALDAKSQLKLSDLSAYGYPAAELAKYPAGATVARISNTITTLQENPLSAPTVFNFYQPDYSPAGLLAQNGIYSPELQIATENSVIQANNVLYQAIYYNTGFPAGSLAGQAAPPYNYPDNAQNLMSDLTPYNTLYMAVVDANHDGIYDKLDTATFNNPTVIRAACEAVLDRADLMLCGGNLKAHDGTTPGSVRMLILDAATGIHGTSNNSNTQQATYMRDRIRAILWLCMSSPDAVAQK
ncbi:MAG: hypothetical protein JWO82_1992, partial [Akkermansiaceae bacterium]|nr:hypothetical protein [Akkermansiaceae bacterium]